MKNVVKKEVAVTILLIMSFTLASCELNLVITAKKNGERFDFFAQTNEHADSSFEAYDLKIPSFPSSNARLYSIVGEKKLIMDSWNGKNREFELVYEKPNKTQEEVTFSFSGTLPENYHLVLKDYEDDATFSSQKATHVVEKGIRYKTKISSKKTYYKLKVNHYFCSDSICSESIGEDCDSCPEDCKCKNEQEENNTQEKVYTPSFPEISSGIGRRLKVDSGFRFRFLNKTHTIKLISIKEDTITLGLYSEPRLFNLKNQEKIEIDINEDNTPDIEARAERISSEEANIFIRAIEPERFSKAKETEEKTKVSIFDERYEEKNTNYFKIIIPLIMLGIGTITMIFCILFLIKRKKQEKENRQEDILRPGY